MIKILEGIKETVSFDPNEKIMLYDNTDFEEYPVHWHSPVEIIMPLEGDYSMECNNVPINLRVYDIIVICPGVLHHIYAHQGRRIIFQIDTQMIQFVPEIESLFALMQPAILVTPEDYPSVHEECVKLMKEIFDEYFGNAPMKDLSILQKFLHMLVMLTRARSDNNDKFIGSKPNKQQEYTEKFLSICDYINAHCTEDLSLDEVADMAGFSKYHFSRLFKEFAGMSFYKYLNARRIAYAERLLLDPKSNVTEVAVKSGFNSISAFMRMFKIVKGCTPTQFRNLNDRVLS